MSQVNSYRPDPVPVVEGSAIGIIPNPMSGKDIRRIISQASVFPNTEKASMVLRLLRTVGSSESRVAHHGDVVGDRGNEPRGERPAEHRAAARCRLDRPVVRFPAGDRRSNRALSERTFYGAFRGADGPGRHVVRPDHCPIMGQARP